jgi:hypothetical protein
VRRRLLRPFFVNQLEMLGNAGAGSRAAEVERTPGTAVSIGDREEAVDVISACPPGIGEFWYV